MFGNSGFVSGAAGSSVSPMALGAGALSFGGKLYENYANKKASQRTMDFQERMSSTAYQRAMMDMKKAGLNPILASKVGGASTPGGSTPVMSDVLTPAVNTGMNVMRTEADVNLKGVEATVRKVDETLKRNLIPGSEAISVLTENFRDLVSSADKMLRSNIGSYDNALTVLRQKVDDLKDKAVKSGIDMKRFMDEFFYKLDGKFERALEFFGFGKGGILKSPFKRND